MPWTAIADGILVLHLAFVAFVVLGGVLVLRWPRLAWLHLPAAAWGALVEFAGWVCPLTPLEEALRRRAGAAPGSGSFVERHVLDVLYPDWLTRPTQFALGLVVVVVNAGVYALVLRRRAAAARRRESARPGRATR
jgi:hypothetical protein